ncbi:OmpA family protein [Candidatus Ruminimicrobium bovinum]|uniref:OmpA family protein n=1 Tax=Candidatus Ruminimicrobium bovinum TaxID=3242779 RepID=UPI0039B943AA
MFSKTKLLFSFFILFLSSFVYAQTQRLPATETINLPANQNIQVFSYKQKAFLAFAVTGTEISPNNSIGLASQTEFQFYQLNKNVKIKQWELKITDNNSKEIFISSGTVFPDKNIIWNATLENGNVVEGKFKYFFKIIINKKEEIGLDGTITVDGTLPYVLLQTTMDTIVISEDKLLKELILTPNIGDESGIDFEKTNLKIVTEKNIPVKTWKLKNLEFQNIVWDGKDDIYNEFVFPGQYKAILTAYDLMGNYNEVHQNITVLKCDVKGEISDIVVKEEPRGLLVDLSSVILFSSGSFTINEDAVPLLEQTVKILKAYQANKVLIEGYTDDSETKDPLTLSYNRAQAVYTYLTKEGIQADRLQAVGYGQENPIASNKDKKEKIKNRRVNIIILKKEEHDENNSDEQVTEETDEIADTL